MIRLVDAHPLEHMFGTLMRVTEVSRRVNRRPRSLTDRQLGRQNTTIAADPAPVSAWIVWDDGVEELVNGHAVAWTARAVRVRFGAPPHQHEAWVWAGAVTRGE